MPCPARIIPQNPDHHPEVFTISPEPQGIHANANANASARARQAWRGAIAGVLAGTAAVLTLYYEGFASLVAVWSSTVAYRSLFLVPCVSLWFFWRHWPAIRRLSPRPSALGLLYAVPFGCLWLLAQATQLTIGAQIAAIGMLQGVFITVLGWRICRRLLFPLLLLWLMVPVGDLLLPALIEITTTLTVAGLRLVGMPATMDGNLLMAGDARYSIIKECTGLDFLLGNLLVALVFANLIYRRIGRKTLYVLAAVPVAILANILRTTSVILFTAGGLDLASDHETYGWFVFLMAMVGQMVIGQRFRDARPDEELPSDAATVRLPVNRPVLAAALSIVLLASVAPAYARFALEGDAAPVPVRLCFPTTVSAVREQSGNAGDWRPQFPTAGARLHGVLAIDDRPVDFFVAYYWQQGPASKLIAWNNRLYDGQYWRYMTRGTDAAVVGGRPLRVVSERLAGANGERRLVWYFYWVDGQFLSRPWAAKLLQAKAQLLGGEQRSAVIAFSTGESGTPEESRVAVRNTLQSAVDRQPAIAEMLTAAARGDTPGRACH